MPETEIELDRTYTVPLSRAWIAPRHRRVVRAVNVLREFAQRHMKSEEVKIESDLNEKLWVRGITRPPRRITVRMVKDDDGLITISLPKEEKIEEEEEEKPQEALPAPKEVPVGAPAKEDIKTPSEPQIKEEQKPEIPEEPDVKKGKPAKKKPKQKSEKKKKPAPKKSKSSKK
ncbi:MAG TPA: 50S ribosomal protein L31e [Nitrososphaerales archaeon]|nr:50S ribosomal protein L31e [Nitrososphaerales archaeon]